MTPDEKEQIKDRLDFVIAKAKQIKLDLDRLSKHDIIVGTSEISTQLNRINDFTW